MVVLRCYTWKIIIVTQKEACLSGFRECSKSLIIWIRRDQKKFVWITWMSSYLKFLENNVCHTSKFSSSWCIYVSCSYFNKEQHQSRNYRKPAASFGATMPPDSCVSLAWNCCVNISLIRCRHYQHHHANVKIVLSQVKCAATDTLPITMSRTKFMPTCWPQL